MKNKKKVIIPIVAGVATLGLLTAASYAYFSAKVTVNNKTETKLKANTLGLIYTGITDINISDIIPGDYTKKTFTVENISSHAVDFNIYMQDITNGFNGDLVYTLEDEDGVVVEQTALPVTKEGKSYLKTSISIEKDEIKSYTMTIKFLYSDENQNSLQGKTFNGTVGIDTEDVDNRYSISGLVKKVEEDNTTSLVTNGNLVFFSEHQDVAIQTDGSFDATNLEMGTHEVYYMGDIDASSMTKEQVKANAICEATLSTKQKVEVVLTCKGTTKLSLDEIDVKKIEKQKPICKKATSLNSDTCLNNSNYCSKLYSTGETITYGSISTGTLEVGNAFDCDVNGDGVYDSENERFYYVSDYYQNSGTYNSDIAVLIYNNNVTQGVKNNTNTYLYYNDAINMCGPEEAAVQLPKTSQWKNVSLTESNKYLYTQRRGVDMGSYNYSQINAAARLLDLVELEGVCLTDLENTWDTLNKKCSFLFENTNFADENVGNNGYWMESPNVEDFVSAFNVNAKYAIAQRTDVYTDSYKLGVRPVIEVNKANIEM